MKKKYQVLMAIESDVVKAHREALSQVNDLMDQDGGSLIFCYCNSVLLAHPRLVNTNVPAYCVVAIVQTYENNVPEFLGRASGMGEA